MDPVQSVCQAKESALANQIQMALAKKQLEAAKSQGQAIVELLDNAVQQSKSLDTGKLIDKTA